MGCLLLGLLLVSAGDAAAGPAAPPIKADLAAIQRGDGPLAALVVTYDDLHGLHGGLTLTVGGDGSVRQTAVRQKVGRPRQRVGRPELLQLVALLLELAAWEQRVPERAPVPDESRARLIISVGSHRSTIWERHNDLGEGDRILRVRELMKKIAWQ